MLQYDDQFVTGRAVGSRELIRRRRAQNPFHDASTPSAFERGVDFMIKTPFDTGGKEERA
jgi:hypothetical protein